MGFLDGDERLVEVVEFDANDNAIARTYNQLEQLDRHGRLRVRGSPPPDDR